MARADRRTELSDQDNSRQSRMPVAGETIGSRVPSEDGLLSIGQIGSEWRTLRFEDFASQRNGRGATATHFFRQ